MAGFFGLFDYSKPGPGVSKNEPEKHRFFVFFSIFGRKFWKLCTLNLLYVLFFVPLLLAFFIMSKSLVLAIIVAVADLFLIGPATCGLFYVLRNYSQEKHSFLASDFFDAFKKNLKQSIIVTLIDIIVVVVLSFAYKFWTSDIQINTMIKTIASTSIIMISAIYLFMHYYLYTLMVSFYLNLKQLFKNSFIFAILGLWRNILISILLFIIGFIIYLLLYPSILLVLTIALSAMAFIISFITFPLIKKYMIDPVLNEQNKDNGNKEDGEEAVFEDRS